MGSSPKLLNGNGGVPDDVSIGWQDIFPEGKKFCPFQPATVTPNKKLSNREQVVMTRIYQPCFGDKCAYFKTCKPE